MKCWNRFETIKTALPILAAFALGLCNVVAAAPAFSGNETETIIFFRHGEKPAADLGQLNCQGLNRALALPKVLISKFGKPDAIFAPDPSPKVGGFHYVRPLATVEPTAISLEMPVQTPIGADPSGANDDAVIKVLTDTQWLGKKIFVAWEGKQLLRLVRTIVQQRHGDASAVPASSPEDFDSLYIVKMEHDSATVVRDHQNLGGQSQSCPN